MKLSDVASGLLTLAFGAAVVAYARTFPPMPGQPVGPALFPTVVGSGLAVFGAWLAFTGARMPRAPWIEFADWAQRPPMIVNLALVVGMVVFYALAVDWLGFFITAVLFLSVLFFAFGVRRTRIVPAAVGVTIVIHYGFYTVLRVPLPWGLLEGLAW